MSLDPFAPPPSPPSPPSPAPGYPPIGANIAARARPVSTPPPWTGPEGAAFAKSMYQAERSAAKARNITIDLLLVVVGIIVTAVTYDSASQGGGTYIVAWGPMVYGAIRLFKGLAA